MSTHNVFFVKKSEKYQFFLIEKKNNKKKKNPSYLKLRSTFNIKTILLIRPLLGSAKGGLNSRIFL